MKTPRYLLGYHIWNKADMILYLACGIRNSFDVERTDIAFVFDACDDDSVDMYERAKTNVLYSYRHLPPIHFSKEMFEPGCHNVLLDMLVADDYAALIVPQDDMFFTGPSMLESLDNLIKSYGDKLGNIGGRDAFNGSYINAVGSPFSPSKKETIPVGKFVQRQCINRGPVIYPSKMVKTIGKLDTEYFPVWFSETDYSARANANGFVNGLLSMDIIHARFGICKSSNLYSDPALKSRTELQKRWGIYF